MGKASISVFQSFYLFTFLSLTVCAADYSVTNTSDSGAGSLRQAIANANDTETDDQINFLIESNDVNCTETKICTVKLTTGELVINSIVTAGKLKIVNAAATGIRVLISGGSRSRIFFLANEADLVLNRIGIINGNGIGTINIGGNGGGIYNGGTLVMFDCVVDKNETNGFGGGIYNFFGTIHLYGSTVSNNKSWSVGGGIYNIGTFRATSSTISGNSALSSEGSNAGGIYNDANSLIELTNLTLTDNRTTDSACGNICAGGIISSRSSRINLFNTIVAANIVNNALAAPDIYGQVSSSSTHNIIGNNQGTSGVINGVNNNKVGTPANPLAPGLLGLSDKGGETQTHALTPQSIAVNAGSSVYAPVLDQRSLPRSFAPDIGSYELQLPTAALVTIRGRVLNATRSMAQITVYLTDSEGTVRTARIN